MSTSEPCLPPGGPLGPTDRFPNAARLPGAACEALADRCWSLSRTAAGVPISWAGRLLCSRLPAPRAAGPSGRHLEGCHGRLPGEKIGVRSALEPAPEPAPASPCPDMPSIRTPRGHLGALAARQVVAPPPAKGVAARPGARAGRWALQTAAVAPAAPAQRVRARVQSALVPRARVPCGRLATAAPGGPWQLCHRSRPVHPGQVGVWGGPEPSGTGRCM